MILLSRNLHKGKTPRNPQHNLRTLDSSDFESKITVYGRTCKTKEEKEKTQSLYGLARLRCAADSCGFSLPIRRRDQSEHRLSPWPIAMETLRQRPKAGFG